MWSSYIGQKLSKRLERSEKVHFRWLWFGASTPIVWSTTVYCYVVSVYSVLVIVSVTVMFVLVVVSLPRYWHSSLYPLPKYSLESLLYVAKIVQFSYPPKSECNRENGLNWTNADRVEMHLYIYTPCLTQSASHLLSLCVCINTHPYRLAFVVWFAVAFILFIVL